MSIPIEDYALLSNCRTAALVSLHGDLDWLCVPRFDSGSVFGALLGDERHGRWSLRPTDPDARVARRYDGDTFILVTTWATNTGSAQVIDAMPIGDDTVVVRRVVGLEGVVELGCDVRFRFDYARAIPWVHQVGTESAPCLRAIAGPDSLELRGLQFRGHHHRHTAEFSIAAGQTRDLTLLWRPSYLPGATPRHVDEMLEDTRRWWQGWSDQTEHDGPYLTEVTRSLLVLRALTDEQTGGIVAAATTSLPESIGGERNWDYRYVWLRDAALTLEALIAHGFVEIAHQWRDWLLRAVAGDPAQIQIMYGLAGERDLPERELTSLPGYEGSAPVRIGNGAVTQFQADVIGEVLVALDAARRAGLKEDRFSWSLQQALVEQAIDRIDVPDQGLWETRDAPAMYTHSRVMVWAALDTMSRAARANGLRGDIERWEEQRDRLRAEIDARGYDAERGHFVQHYGSTAVDGALLLLPQVGYCTADDPRMLGTVAEIERRLIHDGFVMRYSTDDGVAGGENAFLACTFWLVEQYAMVGRLDDAAILMERACATANDLCLLSEEYDPRARRQTGNVPQAFSHLALVRAADAIGGHGGRARHRR